MFSIREFDPIIENCRANLRRRRQLDIWLMINYNSLSYLEALPDQLSDLAVLWVLLPPDHELDEALRVAEDGGRVGLRDAHQASAVNLTDS